MSDKCVESMATCSLNSMEEEMDECCIFCLIASEEDKEAEIMKKNEELVCFRDIDPAAPHHYLVIPRHHIHSCQSLHSGHIGLVKRMAKMGKAVLRDQGITDMNDIRLGFHKPPYTSVNHLHLHVLAPTSQISKYMIYKFIPETEIFIPEEHLRKRLKDQSRTFGEITDLMMKHLKSFPLKKRTKYRDVAAEK